MLQKRLEMGQSATRVRTRIFKKKKIDFCFNQVHQMLEGHHEQEGGLEKFVRTQGGTHTSRPVRGVYLSRKPNFQLTHFLAFLIFSCHPILHEGEFSVVRIEMNPFQLRN